MSDMIELASGDARLSQGEWPPAGWVTEVGAAKRMGASDATLRAWQRKGLFGYAGQRVQAPDNRWWRLYAVSEVDRAHQAMKRAAGEPIDSIEAANVWPPAGFVDGYELARLCGVNRATIKAWARQGRLSGGWQAKKPGERARVTVYPEAEVRRLVDEVRAEAEAPFPPPGFVDRYQAAVMFGMHVSQLFLWERLGRIRCASKTVKGPGGGPAKVYAIEDVERAREVLAAEDAAAEQPPEGFLDREGAAAFFDVHVITLEKWQREGRIRGTWHDLPGRRGRRRIYAIAELERARDQMAAEAARPTAPPGFIELHEAARTLGIAVGTIHIWEKHGEMTPGEVVPIPGTSARTKIYPVAEIERVRGEIRKASENFPPAGWVEMKEAARRTNVSVQVWKKWLAEGRVENWRWARRPTLARCKLFAVEETERIVAELGRDHHFFMEPDGDGGWRVPGGYVGRAGAAEIFGVAQGTFVHWQTDGRITCGRWARIPVGAGMGEGGGRRVYPVDELRRLVEEFSKVGQPYVDPADASVVRVPIMSWSKTRFEALIDAADLPLIEGMRWNWAERSDGEDAVIVRSAPSGEQVPLRRIILGLSGPQWRLSHRNRDPLDCRRANLVVKTIAEQVFGTRKRKTHRGRPCTSRFKGVSWIEKSGKWRVQIQKEGARRKLGEFDDEIAAAEAYDEAARELFGEHARLNFPDGVDAFLAADAAAAADGAPESDAASPRAAA
jgi:DNA-binding transcriptional MerR regulator